MSFLSRLADLVLLNILTCICCLPVFTAGAAFTALHYMALKMVREEEGYIIKGYFKSFKQNFKQATIIWIMMLAVAAVLVGDYFIIQYTEIQMPLFINIVLVVVGIVFLLTSVNVFPVLARFDNTVLNTIRNAALISIISLPKVIMMVIGYMLPIIVLMYVQALLPIVLMFGFSLPVYLAATLYSDVLKKFEPQEEERDGDNWVVHDTVDFCESKGEEE